MTVGDFAFLICCFFISPITEIVSTFVLVLLLISLPTQNHKMLMMLAHRTVAQRTTVRAQATPDNKAAPGDHAAVQMMKRAVCVILVAWDSRRCMLGPQQLASDNLKTHDRRLPWLLSPPSPLEEHP